MCAAFIAVARIDWQAEAFSLTPAVDGLAAPMIRFLAEGEDRWLTSTAS
jgi:hypothetical protein